MLVSNEITSDTCIEDIIEHIEILDKKDILNFYFEFTNKNLSKYSPNVIDLIKDALEGFDEEKLEEIYYSIFKRRIQISLFS